MAAAATPNDVLMSAADIHIYLGQYEEAAKALRTLRSTVSQELEAAVDQFIAHARQQMAENPALLDRPQNLLQALLAAQADEDIEFSDLEIYGNAITFLPPGGTYFANTASERLLSGPGSNHQRINPENAL